VDVEQAKLIFSAETDQLKTADDRLDAIAKTGTRVESAAKKVTTGFNKAETATKKFGGSLKLAKNSTQQLGFQIQDIAVQAGAGVNPFTIFAQQGSQLAGILGPGGALIGAVIAITGAIGTALLPQLFKSIDAIEELESALDAANDIIEETKDGTIALTNEFSSLAGEAKNLSQAQLREAILQIDDSLKVANESALDLSQSLSPHELGGRFNVLSLAVAPAIALFEEGKISLDELNARFNNLFLAEGDPSKAFREVRIELAEITKNAKSAREAREILSGGTSGLKSVDDTESDAREKERTEKALARQAERNAKLQKQQ